MKIRRSRFITGATGTFAAIAVPRFARGAAEFSYKLGTEIFPTAPKALLTAQAATKIGEETDGRLQITVYPNNQLGTGAAMLSQLQLGALELTMVGNGILASTVPIAGIFALDFVFSSYKEAWAAADGAVGDYVRKAIGRAGMYPVQRTMWDSGFKQLVSNRPISTPDDMKGLRLGVLPGNIQVAVFKALGASPTPSGGSQYYLSLQTHLIEGAEAGLATLDAGHFYEVATHIAITNHLWEAQPLLANPAAWQRLPKNLREVAERNFDAIVPGVRNAIVNGDTTLLEKLRTRNGMTIARVDSSAFAAVIQKAGLFAQWRQEYGTEAWGLLERTIGRHLT